MIRYRLDDLGWYQFEWLVQSLLKAELGLGVQAWGGRSDCGRDAYHLGPLNFPARHQTSDGPFVFQVKFVENANAAGAEFDSLIARALTKEVASIILRRDHGKWEDPRHYVLVTNAPLSTSLRDTLAAAVKKGMPSTEAHLLGANDLCSLLDIHAQLRRSFPQLLSLRDLDALLEEAVSKQLLERSRAAIEAARDVVQVFVPTSAYTKAWQVLRKNHFVVLEGPPEMGKTAIAWMIAMAQLSQGWQAIVCDAPEDFFQAHKNDTQQLFVADDAFGRTEYDPSRGKKWEAQLHRVFRFLDKKHWLIWTSRKHILVRARKAMDLQGEGRSFPNPGAVLVDASNLELREKALILYRHARAGGLEGDAKGLVRRHARMVSADSSFTPERIRRFVRDRLPALTLDIAKGGLDPALVSIEIRDAIRNPTEHMRKSFRALPLTHKWLLISLLEAGVWPDQGSIKSAYEAHCPPELRRPFAEVYDELTESFVKTIERRAPYTTLVQWTHPSYRDLVIEELVSEPSLLLKFLKGMSLSGIKLALSDAGGTSGERRLPLMTTDGSWDVLLERCRQIANTGITSEITELLQVLESAATVTRDASKEGRIVHIVARVCEEARQGWNKNKSPLRAEDVRAYSQATLLVRPLPSMPDLEPSWQTAQAGLLRALEKSRGGTIDDIDPIRDWLELTKAIESAEPRFLTQAELIERYRIDSSMLLNQIEDDLAWEASLSTAEELRGEASRYLTLADALEAATSINPTDSDPPKTKKLIDELKKRSSYLEEKAVEVDTPEREAYDDDDYRSGEYFDVEGLFADL